MLFALITFQWHNYLCAGKDEEYVLKSILFSSLSTIVYFSETDSFIIYVCIYILIYVAEQRSKKTIHLLYVSYFSV